MLPIAWPRWLLLLHLVFSMNGSFVPCMSLLTVNKMKQDNVLHVTTLLVMGSSFPFFIWNAIVVMLEHAIGIFYLFRWIRETFYTPVVTAVVLLTVLPIAHFFLDNYIRGRFFHDLQPGFLIVLSEP